MVLWPAMDGRPARPTPTIRSLERVPRFIIELATVLSLCSTTRVARADTLLADSSPTALAAGDSSDSPASPSATSREKSGRTAFLCSFLTTGILSGAAIFVNQTTGDENHASDSRTTTALGITAYLAGPSIGHFYAGQSGRAWIGIGVRGLIGIATAAAFVSLIDEGSANNQEALSVGLLTAGVAAMVVDIVTAPGSARAHNEKVRRMSIGPASVGGAPGIKVELGL